MIELPQQNVWSQVTRQDVFNPNAFGSLSQTMNIDLSESNGRLRLGKRLILNTNSDDVPEITGVPCGFWLGAGVHTIAGANKVGYAFTTDGSITGAFTKETDGVYPQKIDSLSSDACISNNALYVTSGGTANGSLLSLFKKVQTFGQVWTEIPTFLNIGTFALFPNMVFPFAGKTYFTNSWSAIYSLNTDDTVNSSGANTIVLNGLLSDASNIITRPFASSDRIWIPCVNNYGGRGWVYEWDGAQTTFQARHQLQASGALAGVSFNDVPYLMDTEGNLLKWNGGTFVIVASLNKKPGKVFYNPISLTNDRFIHPNGMSVVDGKILVQVDNRNYDSTYSINRSVPAGIYEFDPLNPSRGLVHKHGFSLTKSGGTIVDYGQGRIAGAGGISYINSYSTSATRNGTFMAGCAYYTDASTIKFGTFYDDSNDTLQKAGSISTLRFPTSYIKEAWQMVVFLYKALQLSTDKITIKYRTTDQDAVEATITWTSTSTFTVPASSVNVGNFWQGGIGGEVEITQGIGSGLCSHIINMSLTAGVYTVTVDETYTGATGTSKARFMNWTKLDFAKLVDNEVEFDTKIGAKSTWIELRLTMVWTGKIEIEKLMLYSTQHE